MKEINVEKEGLGREPKINAVVESLKKVSVLLSSFLNEKFDSPRMASAFYNHKVKPAIKEELNN